MKLKVKYGIMRGIFKRLLFIIIVTIIGIPYLLSIVIFSITLFPILWIITGCWYNDDYEEIGNKTLDYL